MKRLPLFITFFFLSVFLFSETPVIPESSSPGTAAEYLAQLSALAQTESPDSPRRVRAAAESLYFISFLRSRADVQALPEFGSADSAAKSRVLAFFGNIPAAAGDADLVYMSALLTAIPPYLRPAIEREIGLEEGTLSQALSVPSPAGLRAPSGRDVAVCLLNAINQTVSLARDGVPIPEPVDVAEATGGTVTGDSAEQPADAENAAVDMPPAESVEIYIPTLGEYILANPAVFYLVTRSERFSELRAAVMESVALGGDGSVSAEDVPNVPPAAARIYRCNGLMNRLMELSAREGVPLESLLGTSGARLAESCVENPFITACLTEAECAVLENALAALERAILLYTARVNDIAAGADAGWEVE